MAAFVSEENGKVMLSTAVDPKIFRLGNRNLFQMTTPSNRSFAGAIAALKARDPKARVALVYKDDPFTRGGGAGDARPRQGRGADAGAGREPTARRATDFGPLVGKVVASKAEALLGGGHVADGMALARALHEQKAGLKWLTLLVAPDLPNFADLGDAALGVSAPSQWAPQVDLQAGLRTDRAGLQQALRRQVQERADRSCGRRLCQRAYSRRMRSKRPARSTPGKVVDALNQIDATTMFGRSAFAIDSKEHGLQLAHEMILRQWQRKAGRLVPEVISPGLRRRPRTRLDCKILAAVCTNPRLSLANSSKMNEH